MTERNDIHRPSEIIPEDYEFVAFDYIGGSDLGAIMMLKVEKEKFFAHMNRTGGRFSGHDHGGSCFVCGAYASYLCTWYHAKSNAYIQTGEDCARKLDMSYGDMNAFRRAVGTAREAHAGKKKAIAILADAGLMRAWETYAAEYPRHAENCSIHLNSWNEPVEGSCVCDVEVRRSEYNRYEESTSRDIVGKLVKYGSVSENQLEFLRKLLVKIDRRPILEAQRAAERAAAQDCPAGRIRVTGVVLGLKEVEDNYSRFGGTNCKVLIQATEGFKVYGSRFLNVCKGDTVDFVATIKPSDKDVKFGFFKRPAPYVDKQLQKFLATVAWG